MRAQTASLSTPVIETPMASHSICDRRVLFAVCYTNHFPSAVAVSQSVYEPRRIDDIVMVIGVGDDVDDSGAVAATHELPSRTSDERRGTGDQEAGGRGRWASRAWKGAAMYGKELKLLGIGKRAQKRRICCRKWGLSSWCDHRIICFNPECSL